MKSKTPPQEGAIIKTFFVLLLITTTVLVTYSRHLTLHFDNGDDAEFLAEAQQKDTIWKILDYNFPSSQNSMAQSYFVPIQTLIWRTLSTTSDRNPYYFYLFIILLHAINAIIVYFIAKQILQNTLPSALAALSFAIFYPNYHTTEWLGASISYVPGSFFYLLTLLLYLKYTQTKDNRWIATSYITFFIGLFTREIHLWLIPIITIHYLLFIRVKSHLRIKRQDLIPIIYSVLSLPLIYIMLMKMSNPNYTIRSLWGGFNFGVNMLYRLMHYISYMITAVSVGQGMEMILAYTLLLSIPFIACWALRDKTVLFLILTIIITLSVFITNNFRDIYALSRHLYTASAFWFILIYYGYSRIGDPRIRTFSYSLLLSYTVLYNLVLIFLIK